MRGKFGSRRNRLACYRGIGQNQCLFESRCFGGELDSPPHRAIAQRGRIVLHHFHGAPCRVPLGATAFGLRREHFLVIAIAAWDLGPEDNGAIHRQWARTLSRTLVPSSLPGGYASLLGPNDHDQIASAHGSNINRLRVLKRRFDPDDLFTSAIPLPGDSTELPARSCRIGSSAASVAV
jgi:hypothetical protein